jgi:hypothetical protein
MKNTGNMKSLTPRPQISQDAYGMYFVRYGSMEINFYDAIVHVYNPDNVQVKFGFSSARLCFFEILADDGQWLCEPIGKPPVRPHTRDRRKWKVRNWNEV